MPSGNESQPGLTSSQAAAVLAAAERSLVASQAYWKAEMLHCAQVACYSIVHVQGSTSDPFESYHHRPDYSSGGKAPDEGPAMQLLPIQRETSLDAATRAAADCGG